jgi:hypothetical protein
MLVSLSPLFYMIFLTMSVWTCLWSSDHVTRLLISEYWWMLGGLMYCHAIRLCQHWIVPITRGQFPAPFHIRIVNDEMFWQPEVSSGCFLAQRSIYRILSCDQVAGIRTAYLNTEHSIFWLPGLYLLVWCELRNKQRLFINIDQLHAET